MVSVIFMLQFVEYKPCVYISLYYAGVEKKRL